MASDTPMRCSLKNIRYDSFRILFYSLSFLAQQGFTWPHLYIIVPRMILSKLKANYNYYNHLELEATGI